MTPDTVEGYCQALERYLCRKNDGHLIRIVGPAFEQVCGWAARGVPLTVAQRGIDRYFERYYAKGQRRRPVRIEFCEADVLDVFDEWRRAVGLPNHVVSGSGETAAVGGAGSDAIGDHGDGDRSETGSPPGRRHASLPVHLEQVIARLTSLRAGADRTLDPLVDALVAELDAMRAGAKALRGDARAAALDRLRTLDRMLVDAARAECPVGVLHELERDADAELAPFRARMPPNAYAQSRAACINRLLRDRLRLPIVSFD